MSQKRALSHVIEYQIVYTANITQKFKSWSDGKLKFYKFNNKTQIYNEDNILIGQEFLKSQKKLQKDSWGEEIEIGGLLITINSIICESVRDIYKVFTKSHELRKNMQTPPTVKITMIQKPIHTQSQSVLPTIKRRHVGLRKLVSPSKLHARLNLSNSNIDHNNRNSSITNKRFNQNIRGNNTLNSLAKSVETSKIKSIKPTSTTTSLSKNDDIGYNAQLIETYTKIPILPIVSENLTLSRNITDAKSQTITSREPTQISLSLNRTISTLKRITLPVEKKAFKSRDVIRPFHIKLENNHETFNGVDQSIEQDDASYVTWNSDNKDDQLLRDLHKPLILDPIATSKITISSLLHETLPKNHQKSQQLFKNPSNMTLPRNRDLRISRPQPEVIRVAAPTKTVRTSTQTQSNSLLLINRTIKKNQRPLLSINTPRKPTEVKALQSFNKSSAKKLALHTSTCNTKTAIMTPISNLNNNRINVRTEESGDSIENSQLVISKPIIDEKLTQTENYKYGGHHRSYKISNLDDLL